MHPALASSRPLVFAHRGGSKLAPENTIAAFDRGLAAGADGLELDVHLSRDGVVVVHHDARLDRTTRATGPLGDRTAAELAAFDVPALRDVLARYREARIIIELKQATAELARAVIQEVHTAGAVDRVCLGSFSAGVLRAARAIDPAIATSGGQMDVRLALYRSWVHLSPGRTAYQAFQVPEMSGRTRVVSPRFIRLAHKSGLVVQVWTVDDPADIRRLLDWGVDGIISDRPDVAVEVVRKWMGCVLKKMITKWTQLILAAATMLAVCVFSSVTSHAQAVAAPASGGGMWSGVYTAAQAARGAAAAAKSCASCHGPDLNGGEAGPALVGLDFLGNWNNQTLSDLFDRIHGTMPADAPGSLSLQDTADIIAQILHLNNVPPGQTELPTDLNALGKIKIEGTAPAK